MSSDESTRPADCTIAQHCRDCGRELGAGYLCDNCDRVEVTDE